MMPSPTTLAQMLIARAEATPDALALGFIDGDSVRSLGYAQLAERAQGIACVLREHGCGAGDRVLLMLSPGLDYVAAFFGCLFAGAIAVPACPPRGGRALAKLAHTMSDAGVRHLVCSNAEVSERARATLPAELVWSCVEDAPAGVRAQLPACDPETPAFLQYTSGSTALPKGVMVPHRAVLSNLAQIADAFGHSAASVGVNWLPPFHDMGLIGTILQPIYAGFPTYLMSPLAFVQRPARWLKAIGRYRATTVGAPNFAFELCTERVSEDEFAELDLSSVRVLFCGAEPIRVDTLERFQRRFASRGLDPRALYPCYGLAESTLFVTGVTRGEGLRTRAAEGGGREHVSCGRPRAGTAIRIVDPDLGMALPDGQIGEVWVSGSSLASGYWQKPEASEQTFRGQLADAPGVDWLRTGDLGFIQQGELHPTGRLKDIIIAAGRKLAAEALEYSALVAVGCGSDRGAVAFAVADAGGTEGVALVVELADRADTDLAATCEAWGRSLRSALAQEHDAPLSELYIVRRGELPRTTSGKVERGETRKAVLSGALRAAAAWKDARWTFAEGRT